MEEFLHMTDFLHIFHMWRIFHMSIYHVKNLHMAYFFSTSTACSACDKYQVYAEETYLYAWKHSANVSQFAKLNSKEA